MSSEALSWAFKQDVKPSSLKFTLIALCECANYKTGRINPSIAHIAEITGQDRKTIIANIAELQRRNLIADTGDKVGRTGQIKVLQAVIEAVPKTEQYQKRNSTVSPSKGSQKRDTEPSLEPSNKKKIPKKKRSSAKPDDVPKPEGVTDQTWIDFKRHRKRKAADITPTAMTGIANEAKKAGWPLEAALIETVVRGWQGFKADWVEQDRPANDSGSFLGSYQRKQGNGH